MTGKCYCCRQNKTYPEKGQHTKTPEEMNNKTENRK